MARVKGQKNVNTLIREGKLPKSAKSWPLKQRRAYLAGVTELPADVPDNRTDDEILNEIRERFEFYTKIVRGAARGIFPAAIVTGSAGIGKSFTSDWVLNNEQRNIATRWFTVKGTISAIDLYELAYNYKDEGNVIVLDDADRIFDDEEGLNILKALMDTSIDRRVTWMTDHPRFKGESALPKEFYFRGSIFFLSNRDFQKEIDSGKGRNIEHLTALRDRAVYLDLKLHSRRAVALWVRHLVIRNNILVQKGLSRESQKMAADWIYDNRDNLRSLSIRTALELGTYLKLAESKDDDMRVDWESAARMTLLRPRT